VSNRSTADATVISFGDRHNAESDLAARAVLVGILDSPGILKTVLELVTVQDFRIPAHGRILNAIRELALESAPIDEIAIEALLQRRNELEACRHLVKLADGIPRNLPLENVLHHACALREQAARRRLGELAGRLSRSATDGATEEDLATAVRDLSEVWAPRDTIPRAVNLHGDQVRPERPEFVVDDFSRRKGIRVLWAPPGGKKTHLMLRFVHELLVEPYSPRLFGHPDLVVRRGYRRVLWIATEESAGGLRAKADMIRRGLGNVELTGELRYLFAADARRRITLQDLPAILENEGPLDQVVLDSLTGLRPKVVNGERIRWDVDNDAANDQCLLLRGLAEKHGLEITIIHHTGREEGKGYRGPIEWKASADIMLGLVPADQGLVKVTIEKNRDGKIVKDFLLRPSWGPEGFYLEHAGEASSEKVTPSEKRADDYLRRVGLASQAEIMEQAGIGSRQTMLDVVQRRLASGAWIDTGQREAGKSPVFRHAQGSVQSVQ